MTDPKLQLLCDAFANDEDIPRTFCCDGQDVSPALRFRNAPEATRSFALLVTDPDAPDGTFTHWVLFDVPGERDGLAEGEKNAGVAGRNDFQRLGWGGPCPPPGHGDHRYVFALYALDVESLGLGEGATRDEVEQAIEGHVLAQAQLTGRYRRDR